MQINRLKFKLHNNLETGINFEPENRRRDDEDPIPGTIVEQNGDYWTGNYRLDFMFKDGRAPNNVDRAGHDDDRPQGFGGQGYRGRQTQNEYRAPINRKRSFDAGSSGLMPNRKFRR